MCNHGEEKYDRKNQGFTVSKMLYKNIMVYNKKCSSPNKKVMRPTSVFFVIVCKNWLVPNTNEGPSWW